MRRRSPVGVRGFSLLEALVVIAILAVVAAMAVGLVGQEVRRARLTGAGRDLRSVLWEARMAAVRSGHNVVVEFDTSSNPMRATVFEDYSADPAFPHPPAEAANDGNGVRDTYGSDSLDEPVLRQYALPAHAVFRRPGGSPGDADSVAYDGVVPRPGLAPLADRIIFLPGGASIPPTANPAPTRSSLGEGVLDCGNHARGIYIADEKAADFFRVAVDDFGSSGRVSVLKQIPPNPDFGPAPWRWN